MTISATVVADSIGDLSPRITTMQWRYPKFIHGEVMTHRVFSRNASSSRAIPVERLIQDVISDPVYPMFWGKNQPGMQAFEECENGVCMIAPEDSDDWEKTDRVMAFNPNRPSESNPQAVIRYCHLTRKEAWDEARARAVAVARAFAKAGYHKQIVNRLLEPFCHINVVVTSTQWSNFFALRCHRDAQPEMRLLAEHARFAMERSEPQLLRPGEWHLPYTNRDVAEDNPRGEEAIREAIRLSVARCARVSYLTQEGKTPSVEEDLKLYDRLVSAVPLHASPAEHQATPDEWKEKFTGDDDMSREGRWQKLRLHGNFTGWIQYRKTLAGECQ